MTRNIWTWSILVLVLTASMNCLSCTYWGNNGGSGQNDGNGDKPSWSNPDTNGAFPGPKSLQYGFNTANFFHYYLSSDQGLQEYLTDLDAEVLRFPGGTTANFYHPEEKGYGYREEDIALTEGSNVHKTMSGNYQREQQYISKGLVRQNFIHDFIDVAKTTDAKVLYVANLFSGTTEEVLYALDLLIDNNIDVIGVELGNEYYLKAYKKKYASADPYITQAKKVADAIAAKHPDLPVAIVAAPAPGAKDMSKKQEEQYGEWNEKLAKWSFYDACVTHLYSMPVSCINQKGNEGVFSCAMDENEIFTHEKLPAIIDHFGSVYGTNVPIWLTEWNVQGVFQYFGNTFFQAYYLTDFALAMRNEKRVEIAACHNLLSGGYGFNILAKAKKEEKHLTENSAYIRRTGYYTMELLQPLYQENATMLTGIVPRIDEQDHTRISRVYSTGGDEATAFFYILNATEKSIPLNETSGIGAARATILQGNDLYSGSGMNPVDQSMTNAISLKTIDIDVLSSWSAPPYSICRIDFLQ